MPKKTPPACVECDDPYAPYVIMVATAGKGLVQKNFCRQCYLRQP